MRSTYYKPQNGTNCTYTKLKGEFVFNVISLNKAACELALIAFSDTPKLYSI